MKNTLDATGNGISLIGSFTWIFAWFKSIDWLTTVGVVVAVGGFLMNMYYSRQRNQREARETLIREEAAKREQRKHELEMLRYELEIKRLEKENAKQD